MLCPTSNQDFFRLEWHSKQKALFLGSWVGKIYAWFMIYFFYSVLSLYSLRSSGCQNSTYLKPCSLKFEVLRLIKSSNGEICAWALKSSHLLSQASAASISAFEVKLVLRPWRPILGHFDNRNVWKLNPNHLRTLWNVASDDLKTASEVKYDQISMYFWV